jgi:hypothetical protein
VSEQDRPKTHWLDPRWTPTPDSMGFPVALLGDGDRALFWRPEGSGLGTASIVTRPDLSKKPQPLSPFGGTRGLPIPPQGRHLRRHATGRPRAWRSLGTGLLDQPSRGGLPERARMGGPAGQLPWVRRVRGPIPATRGRPLAGGRTGFDRRHPGGPAIGFIGLPASHDLREQLRWFSQRPHPD